MISRNPSCHILHLMVLCSVLGTTYQSESNRKVWIQIHWNKNSEINLSCTILIDFNFHGLCVHIYFSCILCTWVRSSMTIPIWSQQFIMIHFLPFWKGRIKAFLYILNWNLLIDFNFQFCVARRQLWRPLCTATSMGFLGLQPCSRNLRKLN